MSIVIRCENCGKPIGWADTPVLWSPKYINAKGEIYIDGNWNSLPSMGWFAACGDCQKIYEPMFSKYAIPTIDGLKMLGIEVELTNSKVIK